MDALVLSRQPQQCLGLCAGGALAFVQLRGVELFQRVWPSINGRRPGVWLAAAAHTALALYAGRLMWRAWSIRRQRQQQIHRLFDRSWTIASKGLEAAGQQDPDLGEPDDQGVYTVNSRGGGTIYVRSSLVASSAWEWSLDKCYWVPASAVDSFWYSSSQAPTDGDKALLQRLHVEGQLALAPTMPSSAPCWSLPALDLSTAVRDVHNVRSTPDAFLCPLSMSLMTQPTITPSGATFQGPVLMEWIRQYETDPATGHRLNQQQVYPNLVLRDMIHAWAHTPLGLGPHAAVAAAAAAAAAAAQHLTKTRKDAVAAHMIDTWI